MSSLISIIRKSVSELLFITFRPLFFQSLPITGARRYATRIHDMIDYQDRWRAKRKSVERRDNGGSSSKRSNHEVGDMNDAETTFPDDNHNVSSWISSPNHDMSSISGSKVEYQETIINASDEIRMNDKSWLVCGSFACQRCHPPLPGSLPSGLDEKLGGGMKGCWMLRIGYLQDEGMD